MKLLYRFEIAAPRCSAFTKTNITTALRHRFFSPWIAESPRKLLVELHGPDFDDEYVAERAQGWVNYVTEHVSPNITVKVARTE